MTGYLKVLVLDEQEEGLELSKKLNTIIFVALDKVEGVDVHNVDTVSIFVDSLI